MRNLTVEIDDLQYIGFDIAESDGYTAFLITASNFAVERILLRNILAIKNYKITDKIIEHKPIDKKECTEITYYLKTDLPWDEYKNMFFYPNGKKPDYDVKDILELRNINHFKGQHNMATFIVEESKGEDFLHFLKENNRINDILGKYGFSITGEESHKNEVAYCTNMPYDDLWISKIDTIIAAVKDNEQVIKEVNDLVKKIEKEYNTVINEYHYKVYSRDEDYGEIDYNKIIPLFSLFSLESDLDKVNKSIEDVCKIHMYDFARRSKEKIFDRWVSCTTHYAVTAYIVSKLVDNEIINSMRMINDHIEFFPVKSDLERLENEQGIDVDLLYSLFRNDKVNLNDFERKNKGYKKTYNIKYVENLYLDATWDCLSEEWEYDEKTNTLIRKK